MASYNLIHNRILLYIVFLIALADFLYLVSTNDYESASFFALVGILTAFFSKNMIVILSVAILTTNVLKYGKISKSKVEGMKSKEDDAEEEEESEEAEQEEESKEETEDEENNPLSLENIPKK
jgi:hypothetical protein